MTSPASIPTNVGDGLLIAMRAGAALDNMPQAWWAPVIEIPDDVAFGRQRATLLQPGADAAPLDLVNKLGRRFTNEAANYNALGGALHQLTRRASTTSTCRAGSCSTPSTWPVTASGSVRPGIRPRRG